MDHYIILHEAFDFSFYFDEDDKLNTEWLATYLDASNIDTLYEIYDSMKKGTNLLMDENTLELDLAAQLERIEYFCFTYGCEANLEKKIKPVQGL